MGIGAFTCKSYYSLLRGSVSVKRLIERCRELGYFAAVLTDVNAMYGVVDFVKSAQDAGIQPIVGVEILTDTQRAVLLAKNKRGYADLCRITTALNLDSNFDLIDQLKKYSKNIICISSNPDLLKQLKPILSKDNLFASCNNGFRIKWAKAKNIKPIACD